MGKINSLQIFRGLAAVMVIIAHANIMLGKGIFGGWLIPGIYGVDFFFVLSGFIIMYTAKKDISNPAALSNYIRKRFSRVYPVYFVYTIIALLVNYLFYIFSGEGLVYWIGMNFKNILKTITLYPVSFDRVVMPVNPVAWTLTYEVLFYSIFSLLIIIKNEKFLVILPALWVCCIAAVNLGWIDVKGVLLQILTATRNLEFMIGCAMGYFMPRERVGINKSIIYTILFFGGIFLTLSWVNAVNDFKYFPLIDWVVFGIPYAMIIFSVTRIEIAIGEFKNKIIGFLVYLGDASYSIYLVHFLVIVGVRRYLQAADIQANGVSLILISFIAFIISLAMYHSIEKPIMRYFSKPKAES